MLDEEALDVRHYRVILSGATGVTLPESKDLPCQGTRMRTGPCHLRTHSWRWTVDWTSRRVTAILENALQEDRATRDATTYACIDPNQRASATILAKQDCVLSGLGCVSRILDVFATLDGTVTSHPEVTSHTEIFDGVRLRKGQSVAVIVHNARVILSCERVILNIMQRMSGIATLTRHYVDAVAGTKTVDSRHAQNRARPARARQIGGALRRRHQSPARPERRHSDQEQSHCAGGRRRARAGAGAAQPSRLADDRDRSALAGRVRSWRWNMAPKPCCSTT